MFRKSVMRAETSEKITLIFKNFIVINLSVV